MCPVGAYAVAFELLVAPLCDRRCLLDDDVGLMGIRSAFLSLYKLCSGSPVLITMTPL